ncbi:MAG: diaminopimelate epimerase [Methanocellales archaeon]
MKQKLEFYKLQANGNDFILIDEFKEIVIPDGEKAKFAVKYCNRRFGIGGDGVLFLGSSEIADLKMRLFQQDESEAEMCGNGVRCLVKHAIDKGYVKLGRCTVETLAGVIAVETRRELGKILAKVNIGKPKFDCKSIPALGEGEFLEREVEGYKISAVNTGVPHAVIFVSDLEFPINTIAPKIRYSKVFPKGANVNFVKLEEKSLRIRTYERGVEDETLSCGTGAVASAAIANRLGLIGNEVDVYTKGGLLRIFLKDGNAYLEGTCETVYRGEIMENV